MYTVWFQDLKKVLAQLKKKVPEVQTFCSIEGNAYGDFVVKTSSKTYIVKHNDFSVWEIVGNWKNRRMMEVK